MRARHISSIFFGTLVFPLSSCGSTLNVPVQPGSASITPTRNTLQTFAGVYGPTYNLGGVATTVKIGFPQKPVVDSSGNLFFSDIGNNVIRKVVLATNIITNAAGSGVYQLRRSSGPALQVSAANICGIAVASNGDLYLCDDTTVSKVGASTGMWTVIAGITNSGGFSGDGGPAGSAKFTSLTDVALDSFGNLYLADSNNYRIRKIVLATGIVTTIAGTGTYGFSGDGGLATAAMITRPGSLAVDAAGNIYFSDLYNYRVRKITVSTGKISTVVGNGTSADTGDGGLATSASITPVGITLDTGGNLYITDTTVNVVRKVTGTTINRVAGNGGLGYSGDGGPALSAQFNAPSAVSVDSAGNLYIADGGNDRYTGDGGPATSATFNSPYGVAVDRFGNIYVTDTFNRAARMISATTGKISTIAGDGNYGYAGDGGPAIYSEITSIQSIAVDYAGNVFLGDDGNHVIRKISADTGYIDTYVGNGNYGDGGDGGLAINAEVATTVTLLVDAYGNLYYVDSAYNKVRMISASTQRISTVAGVGVTGFSLDGTLATDARLYSVRGFAIAPDGYFYLTESFNRMIRRFLP